MSRISWDETFMQMCECLAQRSTCVRLQVAAILVRDDVYPVSIGYNGTMRGREHCCEYWERQAVRAGLTFDEYVKRPEYSEEHHKWAITHEHHAEQNCLANANRLGISSKNTTMYVTHSCCIHCAKQIVMSGIKRVVYRHAYVRDMSGTKYLVEMGVEVACCLQS